MFISRKFGGAKSVVLGEGAKFAASGAYPKLSPSSPFPACPRPLVYEATQFFWGDESTKIGISESDQLAAKRHCVHPTHRDI